MALARPLEEGVDIIADGAPIGRRQITTIGDAIGVPSNGFRSGN
jgi:flagellar motor switch/type III secretory pathway protein FliN